MKTSDLERRASGLLVHLTSLPSIHGNGDLGAAARAFVDFLARSEQSWWQMLPVGPPGYGESPYSAQSAFAGNPLLVGLEDLVDRGLLSEGDLRPDVSLPAERFDAAAAEAHRLAKLRIGFEAWRAQGDDPSYARFCRRSSGWLGEFALFRAIKRAHGGVEWTRWSEGTKMRRPRALAEAAGDLADDVAFEKFVQYVFDAQWTDLSSYAHQQGVSLIGDLPLVVAHDSADVWQKRELFLVDADGEPTSVAGVPPDYFSATGQRWGNPLYRWDRMKRDGYRWWTARFRSMLRRFDALRLDHFIGFERYWQIPADRDDAIVGRWIRGPGAQFFARLERSLGRLPVIAEDLGVVSRDVFALRDRFGFPGIKVLQFAFGNDAHASTFLPHNYPRRAVVYTGTHDNDTTVGWFFDAGGGWSTRTPAEAEAERERARAYLGSSGAEIHWELLRAAWASVASVAIAPLQDVLGLGSEARMNRPGKASGNWTWRLAEGALTPAIEARLAAWTRTYGRNTGR